MTNLSHDINDIAARQFAATSVGDAEAATSLYADDAAGAMLDVPACAVVTVPDGKTARTGEYLDTAQEAVLQQ